jgi:hypothetical protein
MTRRPLAALVGLVLLAGSAVVGAGASPAAAATAPEYSVTFVSRVCPTYGDIMANRARNNIQESLRDLGKDTVYTNGQPISPSVETPNQPDCDPLFDWQFALGTGYTGKTPATDYLSTVTGDYGQTITVLPSTPELDRDGKDTGRTLQAAVTVPLTADQVKRAQQSNSLWAQGGTKADPLLNSVFGKDYGFGALRCSVDNLNGDNVEWIGFPAQSKHVFCYYYAVTPPPAAGTIVVRKQLESGSNGPGQFRFVGNISYTETNDFFLTPQSDTQPASASFVRAAGDEWNFEEQSTAGFSFVSLTCAQTRPPTSGPASEWDITGRKAVVSVGDGATVTCTYVNRSVPPPTGELKLRKVTFGGTGSFPFKITDPDGDTTKKIATTTVDGKQVTVASTEAGKTGTWTARETLPAPTARGSWSISSIQCNGDEKEPKVSDGPDGTTYVSVSGRIAPTQAVDCIFANRFTSAGRIIVEKRTTGGTGTFSFPVTRSDQVDEDGNPKDLFSFYEATTTQQGEVTTAEPLEGYPSLSRLPVGEGEASTYYVGELSPPATATGAWQLIAVTCTDIDTDTVVPTSLSKARSQVKVELTDEHAQVRCVFDNEFVENGTTPTVGGILVTKTIQGTDAGKQGKVTIRLSCEDGTTGTFSVAAGATGKVGQEAPFVVDGSTTCTLTETGTGENSDAQLDSTVVQVGGGAKQSETSVTVDPVADRVVTVAFTDVYGGLAPSGATPATPAYGLGGLLLICLGAVAYAAASVRRPQTEPAEGGLTGFPDEE